MQKRGPAEGCERFYLRFGTTKLSKHVVASVRETQPCYVVCSCCALMCEDCLLSLLQLLCDIPETSKTSHKTTHHIQIYPTPQQRKTPFNTLSKSTTTPYNAQQHTTAQLHHAITHHLTQYHQQRTNAHHHQPRHNNTQQHTQQHNNWQQDSAARSRTQQHHNTQRATARNINTATQRYNCTRKCNTTHNIKLHLAQRTNEQ